MCTSICGHKPLNTVIPQPSILKNKRSSYEKFVPSNTNSQVQELSKESVKVIKIDKLIQKLLPDGEHAINKEKITGGYENDLWIVHTEKNRYVFRTQKEKKSQRNFNNILEISKEAAKYKIGPKVINSDPKEKTILLEYIDRTEWPRFRRNPQPYKTAMKVLKSFHEISKSVNIKKEDAIPLQFTSLLSDGKNLIDEVTHLSSALGRLERIFSKLKPWIEKNKILCHGDFHRSNALALKKDQLYTIQIIDFDCASYGHPYFDIAKFSVPLTTMQKEELFNEYLGGRMPTDQERSHFEFNELILLMVVAVNRFKLAKKSSDTKRLSKEEIEKMLNSQKPLPSFKSISYGDSSAKARQKGAIYALHEFLRRTDETSLENLINNC